MRARMHHRGEANAGHFRDYDVETVQALWSKRAPLGSLVPAGRYNSGMHRHTRRELVAGTALTLLARRLGALPLSQIKLGVTTDEIDDDVLTAAKYLHERGLKWAEVRNIWGP